MVRFSNLISPLYIIFLQQIDILKYRAPVTTSTFISLLTWVRPNFERRYLDNYDEAHIEYRAESLVPILGQ